MRSIYITRFSLIPHFIQENNTVSLYPVQVMSDLIHLRSFLENDTCVSDPVLLLTSPKNL